MSIPETRNALTSDDQFAEFEEICATINDDMSVRAVVLTGEGSAFCAGGNVKDMRDRINTMRELFVKTLKDKGLTQDFSFITRQYGMFSFSGLTKEQVGALKDKFSIYIVGSGRINVAGMTASNMEALCDGIAEVMS